MLSSRRFLFIIRGFAFLGLHWSDLVVASLRFSVRIPFMTHIVVSIRRLVAREPRLWFVLAAREQNH